MIPKPNLSDAAIKLARAREHIAELEKRIDTTLHPDNQAIAVERDGFNRVTALEYESFHRINRIFNAIIGDAVGNLRSTLDYVAVALVKPITGKSDGVGFPFASDEKGFKGEVTKSSLAVCGPAVHTHFIQEVQAYKGGKGHTLWVVNKLRNTDKHRFLLAAIHQAGMQTSFSAGNGIVFHNFSISVPAGERATAVRADPSYNLQIADQPRPTFEVRLNEPGIVPDTSAVGFLHAAASDVQRLLDGIKIAFP